MQAQIDEMKRQIEELKSKMIKDGDKIGFKTEDWNGEEGMIVCSEKNQGGRLIANRTEVGPWETFKVIKK
jgi:hypothetical protein